jgi:uncharacterized protein YbaR (Trm112 family)
LGDRRARADLAQSLAVTRPGRELLRRTFEIDVLACPECGGRLRLLATIEDPAVVRTILSYLGIATKCPGPVPARPPPETMGVLDFACD